MNRLELMPWERGTRGLYRMYKNGKGLAVEICGTSGQSDSMHVMYYPQGGPLTAENRQFGGSHTATTRAQVFRNIHRKLLDINGHQDVPYTDADAGITPTVKNMHDAMKAEHAVGKAPIVGGLAPSMTSELSYRKTFGLLVPPTPAVPVPEDDEHEHEHEPEEYDENEYDTIINNLHNQINKEKTNMSEKQTMGEVAMATGSEIGSAVWMGTKMATYGQVLKRGRQYVETKLGDKYPEFLKTEAGRKVVEWLVATVVLTAALNMPENTPGTGQYKAQIIENARLAVAKASENGVEGMMDIFFDDMMPLMMMFVNPEASVGAPALGAPARDFEAEAAALNAKEKVAAAVEPELVPRSKRPRRTA